MNSALFIRGGAIGDFILTLPAIHLFRDHYPQAYVEIMGYPHIAELGKDRFYAKNIRSIDQRAVAMFFAAKGDLDKGLSEYFSSFDLIISYLYDPDEIFLGNLKRAGATQVIVADGRPHARIHPPSQEATGLPVGLHASESLAQWLQKIGVSSPVAAPRLYPTEQDFQEADRFIKLLKTPTVALHIGSGSPAKNWPMERFIELIGWLKNQGVTILIISGAADSETKAQFWKHADAVNCIRCDNQPLWYLAAILKKCAAFVGHDSGVSHLCAAVETPTISIFGPTDPQTWAPRGKVVTVLHRSNETSAIKVDDVKRALESLI